MRRLLLAVLALGCLAATAHGADLAALVDQLCGDDVNARNAAYNALNREPDPAVAPLLVERLPAASELGQYYGALVLQRLDPKVGTPALKKLVKADSPHLQVVAAAALQRMGERGMGRVIAEALAKPGLDDAARSTLVMRVYSVRDPDVQAAVRALLRKDTGTAVLEVAVYDVYLVRDEEAKPALRGLLEHEDAGVRALAAGCLMVLGETHASEALAKAITGGGIGSGPLYKLESMLEAATPVPAEVLEALTARLDEESDVNALRAMARLLGKLGYAPAAPHLRKLLDHQDSWLSKEAFEALSRLPGGLAPEALRKLLDSGADARRLAAADALRRADDPTGFDVVVGILEGGTSVQDRWEAARILGGFRTPAAVAPLLAALADENLTVRSNAYGSLGSVLRTLFPYRRLDLRATGYEPGAEAPARATGIDRIRAWWERHREADW